MVYLTRQEHFNAAHKLYNPAWSREKNEEVFGKCANENWHGHNYDLYVTVKGTPDPNTGFLFDVKQLSTIIRQEVTEKLDHKNLNLDVAFMRGKCVQRRTWPLKSGNNWSHTCRLPSGCIASSYMKRRVFILNTSVIDFFTKFSGFVKKSSSFQEGAF